MKRLKYGCIGAGSMGSNHIRNVAQEVGHFDFVGIYDLNYELACKTAEKYQTRAFSDFEEFMDSVEAVSLVVPSHLHCEMGIKVAEHGVHALIEKPLSLNSEDARRVTEAFNSRGLKLQVGHIERFNSVVQELDKIIDKKKVFYIEVHRYGPFSDNGRITDTSVVEDLMIHDIDLVCHIMEPLKITDIRANGESIKSNMIDFATCMIDFGSNAHAIINASRVSQEKERSMVIHTEDNLIYADLLNKSLTISYNTDLIVNQGNSYKQSGVVQKIFVPIQEPLRQELISFKNAIVDDKPIEVNGEVGTRAVKICEDIMQRINNRIQ